jgi:hypothetical protein
MNNLVTCQCTTQELNGSEIQLINGDSIFDLTLAAVGACIYVCNNWDDFKAGINEGFRPY